jgi:hypothetical protein
LVAAVVARTPLAVVAVGVAVGMPVAVAAGVVAGALRPPLAVAAGVAARALWRLRLCLRASVTALPLPTLVAGRSS